MPVDVRLIGLLKLCLPYEMCDDILIPRTHIYIYIYIYIYSIYIYIYIYIYI